MSKYSVVLVGWDMGLAHCGVAAVGLLPKQGEDVLHMNVFTSTKSDKKRRVLSADDNARRGDELCSFLVATMFMVTALGRVRAFSIEAASFPRNASSAAKTAISLGALLMLRHQHSLPLVQASPQEIKTAVCGSKSASKEDVQLALCRRYGSEPEEQTHDMPAGIKEHAFDALGSIVCALQSDVVRMLRGEL